MMESIPLRPGPGFSLKHFGLYYANRSIPVFWMRRLIAAAVAGAVCPRSTQNEKALTGDIQRGLSDLRRQGCARLNPLLDAAQLGEVREYLNGQDVVTNDGRTVPAARIPADVRMASYPLRTILGCPHLLEAVNRPEMLELARRYLRCEPTLSSLRVDWSLHSESGSRPDVQYFHRDYDDWRFFKLFIYLTDVDETNGPHEFVLGSHRFSGRVFATPFEAGDIQKTYGANSITRVLGPLGTTFLVDTWGIHRGSVPQRGIRLMFQAQYSLLPVYKFRYRPQRAERNSGVPAYTNRLLLG